MKARKEGWPELELQGPASLPPGTLFDEAWDLSTQHQIAQGRAVHELAAGLFPQAYRPQGESLGEIDRLTRAWIQNASEEDQQGKGILYPGILVDFQFCSAHYLRKEKTGRWTLLLFKSGLKIKERYLIEASWIKRHFLGLGIDIHLIRLLHPDRDKGGDDSFFHEESITHEVKHLRRTDRDLEAQVLRRLEMLESSERMERTYACAFPETCPFCGAIEHAPEKGRTAPATRLEEQAANRVSGRLDSDVSALFRAGGLSHRLRDAGIKDIRDLDKAPQELKRLLKPRHWIQSRAFKEEKAHIDVEALKSWIEGLEWPLFFLDFESYSSAVPDFPRLRAWEHLPFAYSLCRADSFEGLAWSKSYIAQPGKDGRPEISANLLEELGTRGSILVYGKEFELSVIRHLAQACEERQEELLAIASRLRDLQDPFADFHYYHPAQGAKISLKSILPIFGSGTAYQDLDLNNGAQASFGYYFLAHPEELPEERDLGLKPREEFLKDLEAYSLMDSEGLFQILRVLVELVER